jgi:hypothetical protein
MLVVGNVQDDLCGPKNNEQGTGVQPVACLMVIQILISAGKKAMCTALAAVVGE